MGYDRLVCGTWCLNVCCCLCCICGFDCSVVVAAFGGLSSGCYLGFLCGLFYSIVVWGVVYLVLVVWYVLFCCLIVD